MNSLSVSHWLTKLSKSWLLVLGSFIISYSTVTTQQYNQRKIKISLESEITDLATTNERFAVTDGGLLKILDYEGNLLYKYAIKGGSIYAVTFLPSNEILLAVTEHKNTPKVVLSLSNLILMECLSVNSLILH